MATRKPTAPAAPELVEVRVLVRCAFGEPDAVVALPPDVVAAHAGEVDPHPEAVAYAKSLLAKE